MNRYGLKDLLGQCMPWRWIVNRIKLWRLRRDIQAGFDSGPGEPAHMVFDRLQARYRRMSNDRR